MYSRQKTFIETKIVTEVIATVSGQPEVYKMPKADNESIDR